MKTYEYNKFNNLDAYLKDSNTALIYFHGGGLEAGSSKEFKILAEELNKVGVDVYLPNYRLYPDAKYPEFILDAADAVSFAVNHKKYESIYIGGTSAGSYLAMMLYFDKRYLEKHNINSEDITGYIFDAGQPTVHFHVLREAGHDTRQIVVDERAPLYYINKKVNSDVKFLVFYAEFDLNTRKEETELLHKVMLNFGYNPKNLDFNLMPGMKHCQYTHTKIFIDKVINFIINDKRNA